MLMNILKCHIRCLDLREGEELEVEEELLRHFISVVPRCLEANELEGHSRCL